MPMDQENPSNIEAVTHELIQLPPDNYPEAIRLCKLHNLLPVEAAIALEESYVPKCTKKIVGFDLDNHIVAGYGLFVPRASNPEAKQEVQQRIPPSSSKSPIPIFAGTWIKEPIEEQTPILTGLFDKGDKVAIIGQSKTRKSFFALQLAISLATGDSFLDFPVLPPKKVLLIQFEIKPARYQSRVKRTVEALHREDNGDLNNLIIINARGYGLEVDELKKLIRDSVDKFQPDVVILDPMYKLIAGDESKIEEVKPLFRFFDSLAETTKVAVVYVHHDKKGFSGDQQLTDRGAGSGVMSRDYDAGLLLSPHISEGDTLVVDFITRNFAPIESQVIRWENNRFVGSEATAEKMTARSSANKKIKSSKLVEMGAKLVKELLAKGTIDLSLAQFNAKLEDLGMSIRAIKTCKEGLEDLGIIGSENRKMTGNGRPKKFILLYGGIKTEFDDSLDDADVLF